MVSDLHHVIQQLWSQELSKDGTIYVPYIDEGISGPQCRIDFWHQHATQQQPALLGWDNWGAVITRA